MIKHLSALAAILLIMASVWRFPIVEDVRLSFQLFFFISVTLFIAGVMWTKANKWLALLLMLCLFSTFYPVLTKYSLGSFQGVIFASLWYLFLVLYVDDTKALMDAMCIIALCNVAFLFMQAEGFDPIFAPLEGTKALKVGLMSNKNEVATLLAFCAPAFFRKKWFWGLPLVCAGIVLAETAGALLALLVAVSVYIFATRRRLAFIIVGFLILFGFLYYTLVDKPGWERWKVWTTSWDVYKVRPLLGSGLGHYKVVFSSPELQKRLGDYWSHPHNEFIKGTFEMGVGFVVFMAGYLVYIFRRFKSGANLIPFTALMAIFVNSMVFFVFHIATTAMIAVTWMAIYEREGK